MTHIEQRATSKHPFGYAFGFGPPEKMSYSDVMREYFAALTAYKENKFMQEPPFPNQMFRNVKIKATSRETTEAVQRILFENGCMWASGSPQCPQYKWYLNVNEFGEIRWYMSEKEFVNSKLPEVIYVSKVVTKTVVSDFEIKKETVEFNGKTYIKEDLEKALSLLTPCKNLD